MPILNLPETIQIPFDSLTNEQRTAIHTVMSGDGLINPLANKIQKCRDAIRHELTILNGFALTVPPDGDGSGCIECPVSGCPSLIGQQRVEIVYQLELLLYWLDVLEIHCDKLSGSSVDHIDSFFQRLSTAGSFSSAMKSITGLNNEKFSYVFRSLMGPGDNCLDRILNDFWGDCIDGPSLCGTISINSGVVGLAQGVCNSDVAQCVISTFLPGLLECIKNLIDEDDLNYCEAKKIVDKYAAASRLTSDTVNDPIMGAIIKSLFATPQLTDALRQMEGEELSDEFNQSTSEFFPEFTDETGRIANCEGAPLVIVGDPGPQGVSGVNGCKGPQGIPGAPGIDGQCSDECVTDPQGACCVSGNCLDLITQTQCNFYSGNYYGDFSSCGGVSDCISDDCGNDGDCPQGTVCCGAHCIAPCEFGTENGGDCGNCPPCAGCPDCSSNGCGGNCDCGPGNICCNGACSGACPNGGCPNCQGGCCPLGYSCCGGDGCCEEGRCHNGSCCDGPLVCDDKCCDSSGNGQGCCGDNCPCEPGEECCSGSCRTIPACDSNCVAEPCEDCPTCCDPDPYECSEGQCCESSSWCCGDGCCDPAKCCVDGFCVDKCPEDAGCPSCGVGIEAECCSDFYNCADTPVANCQTDCKADDSECCPTATPYFVDGECKEACPCIDEGGCPPRPDPNNPCNGGCPCPSGDCCGTQTNCCDFETQECCEGICIDKCVVYNRETVDCEVTYGDNCGGACYVFSPDGNDNGCCVANGGECCGNPPFDIFTLGSPYTFAPGIYCCDENYSNETQQNMNCCPVGFSCCEYETCLGAALEVSYGDLECEWSPSAGHPAGNFGFTCCLDGIEQCGVNGCSDKNDEVALAGGRLCTDIECGDDEVKCWCQSTSLVVGPMCLEQYCARSSNMVCAQPGDCEAACGSGNSQFPSEDPKDDDSDPLPSTTGNDIGINSGSRTRWLGNLPPSPCQNKQEFCVDENGNGQCCNNSLVCCNGECVDNPQGRNVCGYSSVTDSYYYCPKGFCNTLDSTGEAVCKNETSSNCPELSPIKSQKSAIAVITKVGRVERTYSSFRTFTTNNDIILQSNFDEEGRLDNYFIQVKDKPVIGGQDELSKTISLGVSTSATKQTVVTAPIKFQIINFVADDKIKTDARPATRVLGATDTKSKISKAELISSKKMGAPNAEINSTKSQTINGSLTAVIGGDGNITDSQVITFVSGSNIRLDTNEASNIIRISVDDLNLWELVDVDDGVSGATSGDILQYSSITGQWNAVALDVGITGATGATGPIAGANTQILFNQDGGASGSSLLTFNTSSKAFTVGSGVQSSFVGGISAGGTCEFADNIVNEAKLVDYSERVYAIGTISSSPYSINIENGNVQTFTVGHASTLVFLNPPASGAAGSLTLIITNGASSTLTWPSSVKWSSGAAPSLTSSGTDIVSFTTIDAGTTWYGFVGGIGFS